MKRLTLPSLLPFVVVAGLLCWLAFLASAALASLPHFTL